MFLSTPCLLWKVNKISFTLTLKTYEKITYGSATSNSEG